MKHDILEFFKLVLWFVVLFLVLRTFVIEGYEVQGPSMEPTLQDRQRILVLKLPQVLHRWGVLGNVEPIGPGDIVVFKSPDDPEKRYVKRVIAKGPNAPRGRTVSAGELNSGASNQVHVRIDDGIIYINNRRLFEDYLVSETPTDTWDDVRLQPGGYYVLGDNRRISKDSRSFGPIDDGYVIGKAVLRFWPLTDIRLLQ